MIEELQSANESDEVAYLVGKFPVGATVHLKDYNGNTKGTVRAHGYVASKSAYCVSVGVHGARGKPNSYTLEAATKYLRVVALPS
jgi:hypothetical protein